jgi:hypothetical protein
MRGPGGLATVPPFPSDYPASGCCRMSRRCLRLTESVTWDLRHLCGSIASIRLAKGGGNRFRKRKRE